MSDASSSLPTIDGWRAQHWGEPPCCTNCGDPVILADTEDWEAPLCCDCWAMKAVES